MRRSVRINKKYLVPAGLLFFLVICARGGDFCFSAEISAEDDGFHINNQIERWTVAGRLDSKSGPVDFIAVFYKSGTVMLPLNYFLISIRMPETGFKLVHSGISPVLKEAIIKELNNRLGADPQLTGNKALLDDIKNPKSKRWTDISVEARPIRFPLRLRYEIATLDRKGEKPPVYELAVTLKDFQIKGEFKALDPVFNYAKGERIVVPVGDLLSGFTVPKSDFKGVIKLNGRQIAVSGPVVYSHFWSNPPPPGVYLKYTEVSFSLKTGEAGSLEIFYNSKGVPNAVFLCWSAGKGRPNSIIRIDNSNLVIIRRGPKPDGAYPLHFKVILQDGKVLEFVPVQDDQFLSVFGDIARHWEGFYKILVREKNKSKSKQGSGWGFAVHKGFEKDKK